MHVLDLAVGVALFASPVVAHDLWLIPPKECKTGEKATVQVVSGNKFPTGDHAPAPAKFAKRFTVGPEGKEAKVDAAGTGDKAGLLTWTPAKAGVNAVAVQAARGY